MKVKSKNSPEKLLLEIMELDSVQFLGICKILGINIYKEDGEKENKVAKDFCDLWEEICDKINEMNRIRRRNLGKLLRAANKKEK